MDGGKKYDWEEKSTRGEKYEREEKGTRSKALFNNLQHKKNITCKIQYILVYI